MVAGKIYLGSDLIYDATGGGGSASDQWPSGLLDDGVAAASSSRTGITATASATPHTAGSWVQVDASLSADSDAVLVALAASTRVTGTDTSTLLDIGTGGSGSEVVWATAPVGYIESPSGTGQVIRIPGRIAAGTRVAVRARSAVVSQVVNAAYSFLPPKASAGFGAPVTYGVNTGTSQGVTLAAPGATNTKGAWTEIAAATGVDLAALTVLIQGAGGTAMAGANTLVDIGIGAAAAETVLIPDIFYISSSAEYYNPRTPITYGVDVPSGSRLSARYARASASNAVDLALIGAPPA